MFLTVVAFYFAMQIYEVATREREEASLIEVDQPPEIKLTETQKALARIEQQEVEQDAAYEAQLKALQEVDLLEDVEEPKP